MTGSNHSSHFLYFSYLETQHHVVNIARQPLGPNAAVSGCLVPGQTNHEKRSLVSAQPKDVVFEQGALWALSS